MDPIEVPRFPRAVLVFPRVALRGQRRASLASETFLDVEDLLFVVEFLVGFGAVQSFGLKVGGRGRGGSRRVGEGPDGARDELGRSDGSTLGKL